MTTAAPPDHEPTAPSVVELIPRAVHRMHAANRLGRREASEARERKRLKAEQLALAKRLAEAAAAKADGEALTAIALAKCVPESVWTARGRVLVIHEVNIGDPQGREVIGTLQHGASLTRSHYSTTLANWQAVWHDHAEPWVGTV